MRVSIIGSGYVGLVTGACLAEKGHRVVCVDLDARRIEAINSGQPDIFEEGLQRLLERNVPARLTATLDLRQAVLETDLTLIAVGTPFDGEQIDLVDVRRVAAQIGRVLREKPDYHVVVVKSTVVPGTTEEVVLPLLEEASGKKAGIDFGVGMNPEFLREGAAVEDFMHPDRIVLGGIDERTVRSMEDLYRVFPEAEVIRTTPRTAEMIKYTANSLLATLISFSNEIGNLCSAVGNVDVVDVMKGVHLDRRLTPILEDGRRLVPQVTTYLEAGCGFGGSCFPKDVKALVGHGRRLEQPMPLLESVLRVNESQPARVLELLRRHFPSFAGLRVALLGLAFKPGTDDVRESSSLPVARELLAQGAKIQAFDPAANGRASAILGNHDIVYCESLEEALEGVEAILLMTRWKEFETVPELLARLPSPPLLVDGRRMLDRNRLARYEGIGM